MSVRRWRDRCEALALENQRLRQAAEGKVGEVACYFCGGGIVVEGPDLVDAPGAIRLHVLTCARHPMREAERDLERARATNRRLHRRCQQAEGAVHERILQTDQIGKTRTLGRALANAAAATWEGRYRKARRVAKARRDTLIDEVLEVRDFLRAALGHTNCYCHRCKDLTARFWWPQDSESGPPGLSHAEARRLGAEKHWPGEPEIQGP